MTQDIIERLEKATGPDRELDRAIQKALDIGPTTFAQDEFNHWPLHVTGSIAAALALVERMLPGWYMTLVTRHPSYDDSPWVDLASPAYIGGADNAEIYEASSVTLPLAILLALFRALQAKE